MAIDKSATEELRQLRKKRKALESAMRIAASVERLHQGLKAVMLMGKPTSAIPKQALASYEELDEKTKLQPTAKLQEILAKLEKTIKTRLSTIMRLAELDDEALLARDQDDAEEGPSENIEHILNDYRKSAQTAVALRVLLKTRGVPTKAVVLDVSADVLKEKIVALGQREKRCRVHARQEIVTLINDIKGLMRRGVPEGMKQVLLTAHRDLLMNLKHLDAGRTIESLPVSIEIIEMGEEEEIEEIVAMPVMCDDEDQEQQSGKRKSPGFFSVFWRWLLTPFGVSWQRAERDLTAARERQQRSR